MGGASWGRDRGIGLIDEIGGVAIAHRAVKIEGFGRAKGRGNGGGVTLRYGLPGDRARPLLKAWSKLGAWPSLRGRCRAGRGFGGAVSGLGMSPWGRVRPSARARSRGIVTSRADGAVAGVGRVRFGRRWREQWDGTMSDSGEQNYGERVIHGARARCVAGPPPLPSLPHTPLHRLRVAPVPPCPPPCPLLRVAEPPRERRGG